MVNQNTLHHLLNPDEMSTTHVKAKPTVCSSRSPMFPHQYISLPSTLATALLAMLQGFGMICLMMCVRPLLCILSEGSSRPFSLHKHIHPSFFLTWFFSPWCWPLLCLNYDYWFLLLFVALRVYHQMEIRRYKNIIRITIYPSLKVLYAHCFVWV